MQKITRRVSNQNGEAEAILIQMANHFENNIKLPELSKWLALVNDNRNESEERLENFIFGMGAFLLPGLIGCKDRAARIKFLTTGLNDFFSHHCGEEAKQDIADIGRDFLNCYVALDSSRDEHADFIRIYTVFLVLGNLQEEYQLLTQENKIAA